MLRVAGASAVVRTKLAGASPAPGVAVLPCPTGAVAGLPVDAQAPSTQASRSVVGRMPQYTPPARRGSRIHRLPLRPWTLPRSRRLLDAAALRIRLRLVDHDAVVEVGDPERRVAHERGHLGGAPVVDVLRLVRHLMVVRVAASGEEHHRDAVAGVLIVVAAAVDVLRVAVRVDGVVEVEPELVGLVYVFDQIPELGRQPPRADQLEVSWPTVEQPAFLGLARDVVGAASA